MTETVNNICITCLHRNLHRAPILCVRCTNGSNYKRKHTIKNKVNSSNERYGDNGLNEKPNIQCTNGWN
jgi:hypothetical protein